jgi:putative uncharacterized protein C1_0012
MYNKVFISYAKENIEIAEQIYDRLKAKGFIPWLDKRNLMVGQQWDVEIKKALKESDFIILLLSSISVSKRGYVQREFRLALDYCEEKLDSDIYIIPVKIDLCDVPEKLAKFQYIEFCTPTALEDIINALNFQRQKFINTAQQKTYVGKHQYKEIEIVKTIGDKKPQSNINIIYPQFCNTDNEDLKILNTNIENYIFSIYNKFTQLPYVGLLAEDSQYPDCIENFEPEDRFLYTDNELQINYSIDYLSKDIISFRYIIFTYHSGAGHHYHYSEGNTYVFAPLTNIDIKKLFDYNEGIVSFLYDKCLHTFNRDDIHIFDDSYKKEWDIFGNFYLNKDSINIHFNPYKIASFADGEITVKIPFKEILDKYPNLKTLKKIINVMD